MYNFTFFKMSSFSSYLLKNLVQIFFPSIKSLQCLIICLFVARFFVIFDNKTCWRLNTVELWANKMSFPSKTDYKLLIVSELECTKSTYTVICLSNYFMFLEVLI